MKILYHHRTQAEDGQAVHIRSLQRAFEQEGHQLREVGLVRQGEAADASGAPGEASGGPVANPAESGRSRWGWVTHLPRFARELAEYAYTVPARRRLMGEIARFEPDFLYERYAFGNAGGVWAATKSKRPIVLEVNSPMVLELGKTRGLSFPRTAAKMELGIFRGATRVCVVTRVLGDMLVEMGVDPESIVVTPNGVHPELYEYGDRADTRRVARDDLGVGGLPEEALVLGFVGYYRPWHRLDLAIDALRRPELLEARLVLIGDGPAREQLTQHASQRGVLERVHFAGVREHAEIPRLLPAFDVALIPAINPYASALKLHEYMAAELPVIAPDQPNLREVIVPGENGALIPVGDGEAFADALVALATDEAGRKRMGARARATILEEEMTWRGNARRVIAAVEEL